MVDFGIEDLECYSEFEIFELLDEDLFFFFIKSFGVIEFDLENVDSEWDFI